MTGIIGHRGLLLGPGGGIGYAAEVLADGPSMYWRMGETSGTSAADASGNGKVGTYNRNASLTTTPGLLTSDSNTAALFPATLSSPITGVSIANTPSNPGANFTVTCIIQPSGIPTGSGGVGTVFQMGGSLNVPGVDVINNGSGTFRLRVMNSGAALLFTSSGTWAYGTKVHIKLSRQTNSIALRVNAVAQGGVTHSFGTVTGPFRFGYANYAAVDGYQGSGVYDELAVWSSFISDARTDAQYAAI